MEQKSLYISEKYTKITVRKGTKEDLNKVFALLESRGFTVQADQEVLAKYPRHAVTNWEGRKGHLQFKSNIYPNGFELEFFQEVVTKHKHGGFYDSDKQKLMPYLIRLEFSLTCTYVRELMASLGIPDESTPDFVRAMDYIRHSVTSCWHYVEGKELPGYTVDGYNGKDRDEKRLVNGQVKYFRDNKGRLMRGNIYYSLNNNWFVVLNERSYTCVSASSLFDLTSAADYMPKQYSRKIPQRVRAEKARERFQKDFSYAMIRETELDHLRRLMQQALVSHDKDMNMQLNVSLKKETKILKRTGLVHAALTVSGSYFGKREAITFNEDGFVGFAGWASGYNIKPFVDAFEHWMDWLDETKEQVA